MSDQMPVYAMAAILIGLFLFDLVRGKFDPFAPVWLFVIGFAHVYIVQAILYREFALRTRGDALVTEANTRALWALVWFLALYLSPIGGMVARFSPRAPRNWSTPMTIGIAPILIAWGLFCAWTFRNWTNADASMGGEPGYLERFPILLLLAGILLIVSGRANGVSRPILTWSGIAIASLYVLIWMFNGRRSHSLFGVLALVCAYYSAREKRPSFVVLAATGFVGAMAVTLSLGWRSNPNYDRTVGGFFQFVGDFKPTDILSNLHIGGNETGSFTSEKPESYETEEYGGFLLMMDTVPMKSDYDYGEPYLRVFTTFIPRPLWPSKPVHGRAQWIAAWQAGSESERDPFFTGPAIGILGATQLNGGALATLIVVGGLALLLRSAYEYYRLYSTTPWAQAWWSVTYFNAWLMTVNDDPFVWFYYVYGYSVLPPMLCLWFIYRSSEGSRAPVSLPLGGAYA